MCDAKAPSASRGSPSGLQARYARARETLLLYGLAGGVLLALLKVLEYQYFVRAYPGEIYGGLVAAIFSALGIYFGLRWSRSRARWR